MRSLSEVERRMRSSAAASARACSSIASSTDRRRVAQVPLDQLLVSVGEAGHRADSRPVGRTAGGHAAKRAEGPGCAGRAGVAAMLLVPRA